MSDLLRPIESLPEISFIDDMSLDELLRDMINDYQNIYEELTGSKITLGKADPNRLILNACAIQIYQGFQFIDRAGKQDLLKYSYNQFLDNLAAWKGVNRNPAQPAKVTVRFTLSEARADATSIPVGTKVAAANVYFESLEYHEIPAGDTTIDIEMICTQSGIIGNGFMEGEIKTLVDSIAYIKSVSNTTASAGGSEIETDESLAERTFLAPSSYSVAGPDEAYVFWAKTFSQEITDVHVMSPSACTVDIRFILKNGVLPNDTMIQGLTDYISDKKIKPLTDLVIVAAPDTVEYSISVRYIINRSDMGKATTIQTNVNTAVQSYIAWQNIKIGRDINPSELIRLMMAAGAKRVEVTAPLYTEVSEISVAILTSQSVVYGGLEDD